MATPTERLTAAASPQQPTSRLRFSITMSLDGYVTVPKQSVTDPLAERGDELRKWAFAVRGFRALHGMEGGTTGPDDNVAAESLQNNSY